MRLLALLLFIVAASGSVNANDGDIFDGFGTDAEYPGMGFYPNTFPEGDLDFAVVTLPAANGKLYLIANMDTGPGQRPSIYRLEANGLADQDFGSGGLRTYQLPCADSTATDAVIDSQSRLWVSFRGCADFTVYRFTAAGDLDTSLLGSGVLTIPFDLGGDNDDDAFRLLLDAQGGIIIAGRAANDPSSSLAVAHFTVDGLPQPGFGTDGKATLPLAEPFTSIDRVHRMNDGRLVVTGMFSPNPVESTQIVVRLQANGAADAGFGNTAPGISTANFADLLMVIASVDTYDSLLLDDGSILQFGDAPYGEAWGGSDFVLIKWQADGLLDSGIGADGFRAYGLDFAGSMAPSAQNDDHARRIARQDNGKIVLAGYSRAGDELAGVSLLRLNPDLEPDPSFGTTGKVRHLMPIASSGDHYANPRALLLQAERILVTADVRALPGSLMQGVLALQNSGLLFADSFE